MKSGFIAAVFATALTSVAYADGIPQRHREPGCCAPFSWTGFYLGGHAGWGSQDIFLPPSPGQFGPPQPTGGFAGGQVGANFQFARNWVVGAEVDHSRARIEDSLIGPDPLFPATLLADTVKLDALTTLRGRLGFAWDRTMVYATGGWAWSRVEATLSTSNNFGLGPLIVTDRRTVDGWTVGGGVETALWSNWTSKIEYQFIHSDDFTPRTLSPGGGASVRFEVQTIRLGVNYLFH